MEHVNIHTIGFTKKTAEHFFNALKKNGVIRVIDTRLNNNSQLSGFAKAKDLEFFLRKICNIDYVYRSELAPTKKILDDYKNKKTNEIEIWGNGLAKRELLYVDDLADACIFFMNKKK